jgi:hypothetical protein
MQSTLPIQSTAAIVPEVIQPISKEDFDSIYDILLIFSSISFIVANVLTYELFSIYFKASIPSTIVIFVIGLIICSLILKTELIMELRDFIMTDHVFTTIRVKYRKMSPLLKPIIPRSIPNLLTVLSIALRLAFYNIFNDLFLIIIFWSMYVGIAYKVFNLYELKYFDSFIGVLTVIGILAGIFQYYIKSYKENEIPKIFSSLNILEHSIDTKYTFLEFKRFIEENEPTYSVIRDRIDLMLDFTKFQPILHKGVLLIKPNIVPSIEGQEYFLRLDTQDTLDKALLIRAYANFFENRRLEVKKMIDDFDWKKLQSQFLSNIVFFDESIRDIIKNIGSINEKQSKIYKNPSTYQEFLQNAKQEHSRQMLKYITNFEDHKNFSLVQLLWLVPILFIGHLLEEFDLLSIKITSLTNQFGVPFINFNDLNQVSIFFIIINILLYIIAYFCLRYRDNKFGLFIMFIMLSATFIDTLTNTYSSIAQYTFTNGTILSISIILMSLIIYYKSYREHRLLIALSSIVLVIIVLTRAEIFAFLYK